MKTLVLVALLALLASVAMAGPPTPTSLTTATLTPTWSAPAAVHAASAVLFARTEEGSAVVSRPEGSTEGSAVAIAKSATSDEEGRTQEGRTEGWAVAPAVPAVGAGGAVVVAACRDVGSVVLSASVQAAPISVTNAIAQMAINRPLAPVTTASMTDVLAATASPPQEAMGITGANTLTTDFHLGRSADLRWARSLGTGAPPGLESGVALTGAVGFVRVC